MKLVNFLYRYVESLSRNTLNISPPKYVLLVLDT